MRFSRRNMTKNIILIGILIIQIENITCPTFSAPCKKSSTCREMYNSDYICDSENKCRHRDLLPLTPAYIVGFVLIVLISALANAGGLGGGAVIVPVYMFLFNFVTPESIPMSKATILAGAIMNVTLIQNRRNPKNQNVLVIDFGLAGTCIPLLQAGTMIGVMLTKILPPIIVVILLSIYLIISGWKMYQKARSEQKKENDIFRIEKEKEEKNKLDLDCQEENDNQMAEDQKSNNNPLEKNSAKTQEHLDLIQRKESNEKATSKSQKSALKDKLSIQPEKEVRQKFCEIFKLSLVDVIICIGSYLLILVVAFLRGGHGMVSIIGIQYCGAFGWLLLFVAQFGCQACSLLVYYRNRGNLQESENPEEYNVKKTRMNWLLVSSYLSGIGAGTLGIGGGMIMNPILLSMGFMTEIAAAVAGFSVLFTSSSTTSQFAIAGAIDMNQAFIFLIFSAVGSLIGNFLILRAVDKYRRPSILIWILVGIQGASCLVLPTMGIYRAVQSPQVFKFDSPC